MVRVSVVVTTYNKERELELVLAGFRQQEFRDFELIVADDGSGPKTAQVIAEAAARSEQPIVHSWQEDEGFRAARSRNLAIAKARGELIVMVDGDCVPLPDFLADHVREYREGSYLAGERYLLSQGQAAGMSREQIEQGGGDYLESLVPEGERKRVATVRRKNWFYRGLRLKIRPTVMTCNLVVAKSDLERVNGFDERYVGWGHEDTDLGRRLRGIGVKAGNALAAGRILHLWHKTESSFAGRVRDCPNAAYFGRGFVLGRCRRGLVPRSYEDLAVGVGAPGAVRGLAEEVLGKGSGAEVWVTLGLRGGELGDFREVEVPVLVLEAGAVRPGRDVLKRVRVLLVQGGELGDFTGFVGVFRKLEGGNLDRAGLEEVKRVLAELI